MEEVPRSERQLHLSHEMDAAVAEVTMPGNDSFGCECFHSIALY